MIAPTVHLSPRQRQSVQLAADGHTDPEIAAQLGVSRSTVETHLREARERVGARNRANLVARCYELGLLGGAR